MRVLLAFDKFKDAISAEEACEAAREGILRVDPAAVLDTQPLTDGGEGFVKILTQALGGSFLTYTVEDALGRPCEGLMGVVKRSAIPPSALQLLDLPESVKTIGVLEMAQASGLQQILPAERSPWRTHTRGTGQMIRGIIESGCEGIVLGVGGSATNDGGLGCLMELGLKVSGIGKDASPQHWPQFWHFSGSSSVGDLPIRIACDVENPLLGEKGATFVFGPQKGLKDSETAILDSKMGIMADALQDYMGISPEAALQPGGGAAGGIVWGLRVFCGARAVNGFALVREGLNLKKRVSQADCILTGEGKFDASSVEGKGPWALIQMAAEMGKPAVLIAGRIEAGERLPEGCDSIELSHPGEPLSLSLQKTAERIRIGIAAHFRNQ